eukprot:201448-Rhodomonas_salina.1
MESRILKRCRCMKATRRLDTAQRAPPHCRLGKAILAVNEVSLVFTVAIFIVDPESNLAVLVSATPEAAL